MSEFDAFKLNKKKKQKKIELEHSRSNIIFIFKSIPISVLD